MAVRRAALLLVSLLALSAAASAAEQNGVAAVASQSPRRSLLSAAPRFNRKLVDAVELKEAEDLAEKAIDAAEQAGDVQEAEVQAEALEELEEKVMEVAAAKESEAEHEAAADAAAERGDLAEAEDQAEMAQDVAEEVDAAEEDLAAAVAWEKELATMSLAERLSPFTLATAVGTYSPQAVGGVSAAVGGARAAVRTRLDALLGDYPLLATFLEWVSLAAPVALLTVGFAVLRRDAGGDFSLRSEVLLFGHMYWSGYYALLALATAVDPSEPPLTAFARTQPEQYVAYQVLLLLLFMAYMVLLAGHAVIEKTGVALAQLGGGAAVYVHSYLTVAHPAMRAAQPPTTKGFLWFAVYAVVFGSMTGLIKSERKGKGE